MNSKVILARNIKIDKNYTNVLSYNENQMLNLCQNNQVAYVPRCSFLRTQRKIQIQVPYNTCLEANYIAFQNPDYSNKWFFGWIDDVEFKGNNNTEISYTIDVWSTWFDKWQKKSCFIVRQHVNDDTVGLHTIPENLDIGDLICDRVNIDSYLGSESYFYIVISCNYNPADGSKYAGLGAYADFPQGSIWFAWNVNRFNYSSTINEISNWLNTVVERGFGDSIVAMFTLPDQAFNLLEDIDENHMVITGKARKIDVNQIFDKSLYRSFSDYTPKNNKLYCYPYSFCRVTNNSGNYNDYKIEDFEGDDMTFNLIGIPCQGYAGKLRPINYKGISANEDEGLSLGKYPTLSWSSDSYTNWLAHNSYNISGNIAKTGMNILGSVLNGQLGSALSTAVNSTINEIGNLKEASLMPANAEGNINNGDLNFAFNLNRFKYLHMRPKLEYLQIIDDFFSRYGYKSNKIELPNITGRQNWNYVQIGINESIGYGSVPSSHMEEINKACQRGVTIWHNHDNVGNFNLTNNII